jgi:hypothetical protein
MRPPLSGAPKRTVFTPDRAVNEESAMAKSDIKQGGYVQLSDGCTCEVLALPDHQHMVRVRYIDAPFEPDKTGMERLILEDEITSWYPNNQLTHTQGGLA